MWCVYTIETDTVKYAGMSKDHVSRWWKHIYDADAEKHPNKVIADAVRNTKRLTFEIVATFDDKREALLFESELHHTGYLGDVAVTSRVPVIDSFGVVYESSGAAAKDLGVSHKHIVYILKGRGISKHVGGRYFEVYTGQDKARDPIPSAYTVFCSNGGVYASCEHAGRALGVSPKLVRDATAGRRPGVGDLFFARSKEDLLLKMGL